VTTPFLAVNIECTSYHFFTDVHADRSGKSRNLEDSPSQKQQAEIIAGESKLPVVC
jgi:hypothetical protein